VHRGGPDRADAGLLVRSRSFSIDELWRRYFAYGGRLAARELERVLVGVDRIDRTE
jgi:hypothetical protein